MIDIRVYDPKGNRVIRRVYDNRSFKAGVLRVFKPTVYISSTRRTGTYKVVIRIYSVGGSKLLNTKHPAATFKVKR